MAKYMLKILRCLGQWRTCIHQGLVPQKMVKLNQGYHQILSKVFLSRNMQLELQNTVQPLLRDIVMTTQNVTPSNA